MDLFEELPEKFDEEQMLWILEIARTSLDTQMDSVSDHLDLPESFLLATLKQLEVLLDTDLPSAT